MQNPDVVVFAIDLNIGSSDSLDSSGGFEIRPHGDGDLRSPIQHRRIANPSELVALTEAYDIETTPLIYVLDHDKRIIAKKIRAKQIEFVVGS